MGARVGYEIIDAVVDMLANGWRRAKIGCYRSAIGSTRVSSSSSTAVRLCRVQRVWFARKRKPQASNA
jgi:hypothetical protein